MLQKTEKGIGIEFGDIGVKAVVSKVSAKLSVIGVANEPCVGGSIVLSDGVVFLGNVGSASSTSSTSSSMSSLVRPVSSRSISDPVEAHLSKKESSEKNSAGDIKEELMKKSAESRTSLQLQQIDNNLHSEKNKGVKFNNLKVSLGRNMKMVLSFVLSIQTSGELTVSETQYDLHVHGMVRLVKGNINLLASRMKLSRAEASYVKLPSKEQWCRNTECTGTLKW